ncbi:unnamed protein product [Blumeria hordei]|uniref:Uncharacterized protein n=1 Tax=Blumeria hordei TaxID=2867405 RepID=A0A383V0S6_BLUHO|nr:unnamed protein product [Blumeria hordei]
MHRTEISVVRVENLIIPSSWWRTINLINSERGSNKCNIASHILYLQLNKSTRTKAEQLSASSSAAMKVIDYTILEIQSFNGIHPMR